MKCLITSLIFTFFFCQTVSAENVVVRSADHKGFTRIALDLARPSAVKIDRTENALKIDLPGKIDETSTKGFFNRISKDRIAAFEINRKERSLSIELACDCSLNTFIAGNRTYVIDVRDNKSTPLETKTTRKPENSLKVGDVQNRSPKPKTPEQNVIVASNVDDSDNVSLPNLARMRLLDALDSAKSSNSEPKKTVDTAIAVVDGNEQISFHSLSNSQVQPNVKVVLSSIEKPEVCANSSALDPRNWPKYENATEFLGGKRNEIVEQFVEFGDAAARTLAMDYLSLAMGAEARAILLSLENKDPLDLRLIDLASFIDDDRDHAGESWLNNRANCPELTLWMMLKNASADDEKTSFNQLSADQLKEAQKQFDEWPSALKGVFAPLLAHAFVDRGEADAASFTLRNAQGTPARKSGERELVSASISENQGDRDRAIEILRPVANADVDSTPAAVISLAELVVENGEQLAAAEKVALEIYQDELKGTELEPDLIRARIIVALQAEEFEVAIALIDDYSKLARESKTEILIDKLGTAILKIESDSSFLKEAVSLPVHYFNEIGQKTRVQVKTRIVELGFDELAAQLGKSKPRSLGDNSDVMALTLSESTVNKPTSLATQTREPNDSLTASASIEQTRRSPLKTREVDVLSQSKSQDVRNASPLTQAIDETQLVLDGMAQLKDEIALLGL